MASAAHLRWWAALMPLDSNGARRSSTLACLPTARGTGVFLFFKANTRNLVVEALAAAGWFLSGWMRVGSLGGPGPPLRAAAFTGPPHPSQGQGSPSRLTILQGFACSGHNFQGFQHPSTSRKASQISQVRPLKFHSRHPSQLLALEMFQDSLTSK